MPQILQQILTICQIKMRNNFPDTYKIYLTLSVISFRILFNFQTQNRYANHMHWKFKYISIECGFHVLRALVYFSESLHWNSTCGCHSYSGLPQNPTGSGIHSPKRHSSRLICTWYRYIRSVFWFDLKTLFIETRKNVHKTQGKNDSTETFQLPSSLYTKSQCECNNRQKIYI